MFDKLSRLKKIFASLSDEDKEKFLDSVDGLEEKVEEAPVEDAPAEDLPEDAPMDAPEEEVAEEPTNDEEAPMTEEVEEPAEEAEPTEEEIIEDENIEESEEENQEDVVEILGKKVDNTIEQLNGFMDKVEKFMAQFDSIEDADSNGVGLEKRNDVEMDTDDDNLTAYEYAMKHAKY